MPPQNPEGLEKSASSCNHKAFKPVEDPNSYRPISLLCFPFKSIADQVTLFTQGIEDAFETKTKASVVFVDVTAAYDTVWFRGRT